MAEPARDVAAQFVIGGDVAVAAQQEVTTAEASGDGERMAHAYMPCTTGTHDAPPRAQSLILNWAFLGS